MGGCASRPKDMDVKAEAVPEAPLSPRNNDATAVSQEGEAEGVETQKTEDAPAGDACETKEEEAAAASAEAEKPVEEVKAVTESTPEEPKVEAHQESEPEETKAEAQESKSEETVVEAVVVTENKDE